MPIKNAKDNVQLLKTRVSPIALWRALRCATATGVPALLGAVTGNGDFGWASLGGFEGTLADLGGSYQARFTAMALLSLAGAFGLFLGMISNGHLWTVFLCTVIWSFIWAYATVLGGVVNAFNALVVVIFLCGVETHVQSWQQAAHHALYLLGGAVWAMALSLLVWPIHPYRPARRAIGQCYEGLATLLTSTLQQLRQEKVPVELWHEVSRNHQYAMRNTLENARTVIAATRAQQRAENLRGEQFLVLLETADVMLGYAIAVTEHAEQVHSDPQVRPLLTQFLEQWSESLLWVSNAAAKDRIPTAEAREQERQKIRKMLSSAKTGGDAVLRHLARVTGDAMDVAIASAYSARTGLPVETGLAVPIGPSHRTISLPSISLWQTLHDAWSWDSVTLRHALRVCVVCGAGILLSAALHLNHGYWIPMTSVIVMRPHLAATWTRSLERTLGSAAGGTLAAAIIFLIPSKLTLAALLIPLSFATLASLPVSYALFVFFLTPTFVIASLPHAGDWQLALVRAVDTTLGAALALPAMYGLWPLWQHEGFLERLADSFRADVSYFGTLQRSWREPGTIGAVEIARARRQTGLSNNAAEDALDQLLNEPKTDPMMREPASTFVTYARRLAQSVTTLHNHPPEMYGVHDVKRLAALQTRVEKIEEGLRTGSYQSVAENWLSTRAGEASDQIDVLERQVSVLENATARMLSASAKKQAALVHSD